MEGKKNIEEIYSKSLRAGRRTYFFDVRSTKAGDYYMTITESKRDFTEDGTPFYKKHKIYLYKEDFVEFKESLDQVCNYIIQEKGSEIITTKDTEITNQKLSKKKEDNFTEVNFDELGEK